MTRRRLIKPEFRSDEKLARLSLQAPAIRLIMERRGVPLGSDECRAASGERGEGTHG
jgi:hypothetical protein